jgi:hypothetical protein
MDDNDISGFFDYSQNVSSNNPRTRTRRFDMNTDADNKTSRTTPFLDIININTDSGNRGVITSPKPIISTYPTTTLNDTDEKINIQFNQKSEEGEGDSYMIPVLPILDTFSSNRNMMRQESESSRKLSKFRNQCSKITNWLYVSGQNVAKDKKLLKNIGITHIVNAAGGVCPNYHSDDDSLEYHTLHVIDSPNENIICIMYDLHDFIETARNKHQNNIVLIHCQLGVSRSTSLCIG